MTDLQGLRDAILVSDEKPATLITKLGAWVEAITRLEPADRERLRERGLDTTPLQPLLTLRRMSGEPRAVWTDRAYRRLQDAVPVLDNFELQLCRTRDDAYR